ncbi:MAG: RNA polymerase factor sigma-32 [Deltaproteobacteria bacterium]|nr:RNA polymerase factor sigma-32 [Deltaproteobacteria bacterium]
MKKTRIKAPAGQTNNKSATGRRSMAAASEDLAADRRDEELLRDEQDENGEEFADDSETGDDIDSALYDEGDGPGGLLNGLDGDLDYETGEARELKALPPGGDHFRLLPKISDGGTGRDGLGFYMREVNRFPLLEGEEETILARRVRDTGDPDAAFRLISSHLRLVVRIAMDFQRRWMQNVLDLIQEGNVGLVRAVSKFDPEKGIKFSYYAAFWIKAYILKFIMDNWRMVKIGTTQAQRKLFYNLNKERQRLISQGFDPDTAAMAKSLNVTEEQVSEMEQRMGATDMSLNLPMNSDEPSGSTRMDYLPALGPGIEDTLANSEIANMVQGRLQSLIPSLSDKEQYILSHRLLTDDPVTLREIGEKYDITRERVRQIEARLLQKVRDHLFSNIKDFSQDWINPQ